MKFDALLQELDKTSQPVEPLLFKYASDYLGCVESLRNEVSYSFFEIGKRARPFLLRTGFEIGGGEFKTILPIAAAIELMQAATLVIDDILDEAKIRNARPSIQEKYGVKKAILIGELLKSLAMTVFINHVQENKQLKNLKEPIKIFEDTYREICVGQYLDLNYECKEMITEDEYYDMVKKTTASFIQAPLVIGAMFAGTPKRVIELLKSYGLALGYAYQIRDDVTDVIGEEEFTGKPFAIDIKQRKKRLPVIHVLSNGSASMQRKLREHFSKDIITEKVIQEIVDLLYECGSIDYSIKQVRRFSDNAIEVLSPLKDSNSKAYLIDLAELIATF